jgi:predicted enzyme related to lactoylglutathione lyase
MEEPQMAAKGNDRQIDNIELRVGDIGRARQFYERAFGWAFTDYGPTYCEFNDGRLTGGLTIAGAETSGGSRGHAGTTGASRGKDHQADLRVSGRTAVPFPRPRRP